MAVTVERQIELWNAHKRANAPLSAARAAIKLREPYPAWRLGLDGTIVGANQLALYLWGAHPIKNEFAPRAILGKDGFSIFVRNFERISPELNTSFWAAKFRADHLIHGDDPTSVMAQIRGVHPELQALYENIDIHQLKDIWHYTLRLKAPDSDNLLVFRTTVRAVIDDGQPAGFLALYEPLIPTDDIMKEIYNRVSESTERSRYVRSVNEKGGEADDKMKEQQIFSKSTIREQEDEARWREILGPYLTSTEVQQRLRLDTYERVGELANEHMLLSLPTRQGVVYPAFQFREDGKIDPTIAQVVHILSDVVATPYTTAAWLKGRRRYLDNQTPLQWLDLGRDPERIIEDAAYTAASLE